MASAIIPADAAENRSAMPPLWPRAAWLIALVWGALLLTFYSDAAAMALLWWDSSTFNHILLIPAIIGWLVWQPASRCA